MHQRVVSSRRAWLERHRSVAEMSADGSTHCDAWQQLLLYFYLSGPKRGENRVGSRTPSDEQPTGDSLFDGDERQMGKVLDDEINRAGCAG